ncbi:MAG: CPBP family intramembrane metalloprotease [Bacteroidetes bacterium]|nr:CPBP family intramembrane metalloprotease [Bacteroidota bacterium]
MRLWLLIVLNFACVGLFQLFANANSLAWLGATSPSDGYPLSYARTGQVISEILFFMIPAMVYANIFPMERFSFFRHGVKVDLRILLIGILVMILIIPGLDAIAQYVEMKLMNPDLKIMQETGQQASDWMESMPDAGNLFIVILVSGLVPAVCEELFFRGCIQQVMIEWTKKKNISVFVTALFFAFIHFNPAGFLSIFLAGLILGYAFLWTGSLRTNVLMHFFFNATSILIEYGNQHSKAVHDWEMPMMVVAVTMLLGAGSFFFLWKFSKKSIA